MELVLLFFAVLLTVGAYGEYYRDTARAKVAPNRWSWLIWSATTGTEVATFQAVSGDFATTAVFFASMFACIAITLLVWGRACWRAPTTTELICVGACLAASVVWLVFHQHWWAHLLMLAVIPVSFLPTYRSAWVDYRREDSPSWALWTIGDMLAMGYVWVRHDNVQELPYAVVEMLCHAGVWLLIWRRRATMVKASLPSGAGVVT